MAHIEISILCGGNVPQTLWDELYSAIEEVVSDFEGGEIDFLVSGIGPVEVATIQSRDDA